ncbi:glycosyltransferase family 2 protein [Actinokineospora iranica]|uniref:Glycosyltransferase, catalytic subunit of cellulose synthase and poly-beta-1,6-N-acetylglucosamine synthase n=1 Tax=Actinokineospora iranica TaxID=1271860 RepID=A0A1G6X1L3_9PSEU|nr:glycosyltransferase family 2 protein [Actinokineospora iranica]SDD72090.1 Glycosyltransferase, catalytic subunit of cellulose synthase and poly-beta-1,6-N-acetylglucosamine synthase [Actinokineospora iranica]
MRGGLVRLSLLMGFTQALALTMSVAFLTYVCLIVVPYLRRRRAEPGDPDRFDWHFFVPCRDEEAVIGGTVRYLREHFPRAHVWVIDDASEDGTASVVTGLRGPRHGGDRRLHLISRRRPDARTGKGEALNSAYRALKEWLGRHTDPSRVVVVVVDADGRPAPDCLSVCAADHLFGDPRIGAVQIDVRMINRGVPPPGGGRVRRAFGLAMVRMQDLEFRGAIAAIQLSRGHTGTIAMGGNGQFTRLSALDSIAEARGPWRGALLEDFELGVHLLTEGWKTGFTMDTHVDQEGLYSLRRFLAQRTRWGQGTMQCSRYLRRIWDSRYLSTLGAAEMLYYLAQPWMQLLGTVVYPMPFILLAFRTATEPGEVCTWFFTDGAWVLFVVYGSFGLLPFVIWGPIYRKRCEPSTSFPRALAYGFAYALYIYTFYITSWRAAIRLLRGHNGWTKTRRNTEPAF